MTAYDRWLEAPYQDRYAEQERQDYLGTHTCPQCRTIQRVELEPDAVCEECAITNDTPTPLDMESAA